MTRERFRQIKDTLWANARPGDDIILAMSGHGTVDYRSPDKEFYFASWDMDFSNKADKGISYYDIQWLLDSIPAQNKLVLLDACGSGGQDPDVGEQISPAFELMQEMYVNVGRNNGATVIAATAGDKSGFESPILGNSVFTHYILMALLKKQGDLDGNGLIRVSELEEFVSGKVMEHTLHSQKPASRSINYDNDWVINPIPLN